MIHTKQLMMTGRKTIYTIAGMVLLGSVYSCHFSTGETQHKTETKQAITVPVPETFVAQKGILSATLQVPGELIAFQQVDIYAKENSFVKKIYVDVGSEVAAGQLLAVMEAPELNSQLSAAASRLKSQEAVFLASKANYERLLETSKTPGTIAPNELDLALAKKNSDYSQLEAAKASYNQVMNTRDYLEIRAPFNGVISVRNANPGAYVGPSGKGSEFPMFVLQEQKKLRLAVAVPEAYTSYLHENDSVLFTVNAYPSLKFSALTKRFAGALDTKLRSQRIEMDVLNPDKKLLPRMAADVQIPLIGKDSVFIVPKSAIVNSQEKVFVIRVSDNKLEWIDVKTGSQSDGRVEIFGNLKKGDILIKKASEELRNGAPFNTK